MAGSGRAVLVDARSRMMSVGGDRYWKGLSFVSEFFLFFLGFRMVRAPGEACGFPSSCQKRGRPMGTGDSAWEAIPMSYINTLVDSMPRRLEAVRAAQGETKY